MEKVKRVLNKSLNGLKSFMGEEPVRAFVSGEEVKVEGQKFDYVMKKSMSLIKYTKEINSLHIPYNLSIYTKSGEYITKICVVFPGSPVLDQVLSLYLMVKSGREEELLRAGNFYGERGDAYYNDPQFKQMFDTKFKVKLSSDTSPARGEKEAVDLNFIGISMGLAMGREYSNETKELMLASKNIKEKMDRKYPQMQKKILNTLLVGTGLDSGVKESLERQELSWDEVVDFCAISVLPMPTHLDGLKSIKTGVKNFSNLYLKVGYDFEEGRINVASDAPKKIAELAVG